MMNASGLPLTSSLITLRSPTLIWLESSQTSLKSWVKFVIIGVALLWEPRRVTSRYCSLWVFLYGLLLKALKRVIGKGFHTLINDVSFSSPNNVWLWNLTIHPLLGLAFSLTLVPFSNQCGTPAKSTSFEA